MIFAWTRTPHAPSDQQDTTEPSAKELTSAALVEGNLVANGEDFYNIRRIQNVELRSAQRHPEVVDVYIGYEDPAKQPMFTRMAIDRVFAGSTARSSDVYDFFRNKMREIGIPVIDISG